MKAQGTYTVVKWDESPYETISPTSKLTRASVEYQCAGDIEGKLAVQHLMFYSKADPKDQHNSTAEYTGIIRFQGNIQKKAGSFIVFDKGSFQGGMASSSLEIAAGSGTEALQGITGKGSYKADKNGCTIELEYFLP